MGKLRVKGEKAVGILTQRTQREGLRVKGKLIDELAAHLKETI